MKRIASAFLLVAALQLPAFAADPAASINKAREEITAGRHAAALRHLREATPGAAALVESRSRNAALSAIYFYSAVAAFGLGDEAQAKNELRTFFFYSPNGALDQSKYPARFAQLFADTRKDATKQRDGAVSFDDAYPGYPVAVSSSVWPLDTWGASSEFVILGTTEEKAEWDRLGDTEARKAFIERFWLARDPDKATKLNEARIEFLGRIAFADVAFAEDADGRGSLTDRGRVFVLLGIPKRVDIRPLSRREAWTVPTRTMDSGNAMEQWIYFREQMPQKLPHNEVTFRFISDNGSSIRRLQRDFLPEKVTKDAPAALRY